MADDDHPKEAPAPVSVNFVDSPHSPVLYATGVSGFWLNQGTVQMTFEVARISHGTSPGPVNRVVIGTVAMPVASAYTLGVGIFDFLKNMGFEPPAPPNAPPSSKAMN